MLLFEADELQEEELEEELDEARLSESASGPSDCGDSDLSDWRELRRACCLWLGPICGPVGCSLLCRRRMRDLRSLLQPVCSATGCCL